MNKNKTTIAFTGDIGFDRYMDGRWDDDSLLSKDVLDFFYSADHVCANVEGALTDMEDDGSRGVFFHSMNPKAASVLKKINADIWCIGNNHSMDAGREGLISTRKIADSLGVRTIGAGLDEVEASEPVYLDEAGGIGIFSVSYTPECIPATATTPGNFRWDDMDYIARRISEIKNRCRWCVVVVHGGEEFTCLPSPYTRDRYLKYIELGADVVVGHHPHVPENYELLEDGKAIFYSLGNFIFDTDYQRIQAHTDLGVLVKLSFDGDKLDFTHLTYRIERETHTLKEIDGITVFRHMSPVEYAQIVPLSTHIFRQNFRRASLFLRPYKRTMKKAEFYKAYNTERHPSAVRLVARDDRRYLAVPWRRSNPDLIAYILEKAKK